MISTDTYSSLRDSESDDSWGNVRREEGEGGIDKLGFRGVFLSVAASPARCAQLLQVPGIGSGRQVGEELKGMGNIFQSHSITQVVVPRLPHHDHPHKILQIPNPKSQRGGARPPPHVQGGRAYLLSPFQVPVS